MVKKAPDRSAGDPLALRLAALASLMDHVIVALRKRTDRIRDVGIAIAVARNADEPPREPQTGVRRRDLRE